MIITREDVRELDAFLEELYAWSDEVRLAEAEYARGRGPGSDAIPLRRATNEFFADRPHYLLALGFDDFRAIVSQTQDGTVRDVREFAARLGVDPELAYVRCESFYRDGRSGEWQWFEGVSGTSLVQDGDVVEGNVRAAYFDKRDLHAPELLHFVRGGGEARFVALSRLFEKIEIAARHPELRPKSLLLPGIWTPSVQSEQRTLLEATAQSVVAGVAAGERELDSIHWRELEELVAELLRAKGLEVFVTPRSHDGGRDVIARGELIPGEPTVLAVEVKQKRTVSLADVQRALKANEEFPALLVATSGAFSTGVIQEKSREKNQLRLFLKDGVALRQWINAYQQPTPPATGGE
jgi:Holliday junction resolvase-like predicted endonuclease